MKIAVDLDDVCMDFYKSVHECVKKEFGVEYDFEAVTDWDVHDLKQSTIFGEGQTWWDWLKSRDWLWAQFPAVDGAVGGVRQLRQQGHYVEGLTTKPEWAEWTVWSWLGKWRIPFSSVTIINSGSKADATTASLLIDDNIDNCNAFVDAGRWAILFEQPWNRNYTGDFPRLYRASNWQEVLDAVNEIWE